MRTLLPAAVVFFLFTSAGRDAAAQATSVGGPGARDAHRTSQETAVDAPLLPALRSGAPSLAAAPGRLGVAFGRTESDLLLASCRKICQPSESVVVRLPDEVGGRDPKIEVVPLATGARLLHLSWGTKGGRTYHVFTRGGVERAEASPPEILVKGFTGGERDAVVWILGDGKEKSLVLGRRDPGALCGRDGWLDTRRYVPSTGTFEPTRIPPFGTAERKKAQSLPSRATPSAGAVSAPSAGAASAPTAAAPTSPSTSSSGPPVTPTELEFQLPVVSKSDDALRAWVDGDRAEIHEEAWGTLEVELPPGATRLTLRGSGAERIVWIETDGRLFRQVASEASVDVDLPPRETARCLVIVADGRSSTWSEITFWGKTSLPDDARGLVLALDGEEGDAAARALVVREGGADAVAAGFGALSAPGRKRALGMARSLRPELGSRVFLAAALGGSPGQKKDAELELASLGAPAIEAVRARFLTASAREEDALAELLGRLAPGVAVDAIVTRLDQKSSTRRAHLRGQLLQLVSANTVDRSAASGTDAPRASESAATAALRAALVDPARSRASRREALRALGARVGAFEPAATRALELAWAGAATFEDRYLTVEAALVLAATSRRAAELLRAETEKARRAKADPSAAAWLTLVFDRATTPGAPPAPDWLGREARELLEHESPRVRQVAARYLGERGALEDALALAPVVEGDAWPLVREEGARAVGEVGERAPLPESLEGVLLGRLGEDPSDRVRRGAARALRSAKSERSLEALRDAFGEDASYAVRGEAAVALGRRCDYESLDRLTAIAARLTEGPQDENGVEYSLAALTALGHLSPPDLSERLAPLLGESVPGPLRGQVRRTIESARVFCGAEKSRSR